MLEEPIIHKQNLIILKRIASVDYVETEMRQLTIE